MCIRLVICRDTVSVDIYPANTVPAGPVCVRFQACFKAIEILLNLLE